MVFPGTIASPDGPLQESSRSPTFVHKSVQRIAEICTSSVAVQGPSLSPAAIRESSALSFPSRVARSGLQSSSHHKQ